MEYGKVAGIDKPVSRMVFGTDRLRSRRLSWLPDWGLEHEAYSLLDRSFELGCNSFDTARTYRDSERALRARIRNRRNRDKVVVISTGCHPDGLGRPRLSASTVQFSLADSTRSPWPGAATIRGEGQRAARDWCSKDGLSVFAWSTLSRGFYSNHYDPKYPAANRVSLWCATYFGTEKNIQRPERVRMFARRHHVTVAQAALAYVLRYPLQVFAMVGCTTLEKSVNNVGAQSLKRDGAALQWLATGEAWR